MICTESIMTIYFLNIPILYNSEAIKGTGKDFIKKSELFLKPIYNLYYKKKNTPFTNKKRNPAWIFY